MSHYFVTIVGNDISRARSIPAASIDEAIQKGDDEFGDGFLHHKIIVCDREGITVASRLVSADSWWRLDEDFSE
jgi:hypothetical protein